MNKFFYSHLAITNIKKHKSIYFPYLISSTLIISLFYILDSISIMVKQSGMKGSSSMSTILELSTNLCAILSIIILFYINSFVIKRRKKEFGLYVILGMEKRHISIVILWEVLITSFISIIGGIVSGALLSQLIFLILLKMIKIPTSLTFQIPVDAVFFTLMYFGIGFILVLIYDIISICRANAVDLLVGAREGEREPKARWLLALCGVVSLSIGYGLAQFVKTPYDAINIFFLAVLCVMIGTYFLFIAGSIAILKLLRRKKRFYYKASNFISVSGMIYRMKQNAAGLSTICILSSCVLVTLSSTVSLFIGEEDTLQNQFSRQINITCIADKQSPNLMEQTAKNHAKKYGFTVKNAIGYMECSYVIKRNGTSFSMDPEATGEFYAVETILLEDYNRIVGIKETLDANQVLTYVYGKPIKGDTITLGSQSYKIKQQITAPTFMAGLNIMDCVVIVFPEFSTLEKVAAEYGASESTTNGIIYNYLFDVEGDSANLPEYYASMRETFNKTVPHIATVRNIDRARDEFYQLYGSILFVGIFFTVLFLITTILIIYYKQITEGFDDHDRFQIMQKIGMSSKEVKKIIHKQVLMVFFLPLGMAILHIFAAFRVICKLLTAFSMTNTLLFFYCTLGTILVFTILYSIVYRLTARTYYQIVQGNV